MKIFIFAILAITLHQSFATVRDSGEALETIKADTTLDLSENLGVEFDSKLPFSCECDNISRCMCCGNLDIPRLKINREACVRLTYNGDKTALTTEFITNDKTVFSKTVSGNNPPRMCFSYPPGNIIADLCFKFHDVQVKLGKFHSCLDLSPRIMMNDIMTIKIGCFQFGGQEENKEEFVIEKNSVEEAEMEDTDYVESGLDLTEDYRVEFDSKLPFSCECDNISRCMCCGHLDIPRLKINREACVRLTYYGDKTALTTEFITNDKTIFSKTVSGNNPPRMCFSYPPGNIIADLCFKFHDVRVNLGKFHSCLDLSPRIMMNDIMTIKIGCFQFGGKDENKEEFAVEKE